MAKQETVIGFGEDTDTDTLCGVLQALHGWNVLVITRDGQAHAGAILRDTESTETCTLVPEHDLTLPNVRVELAEIASVVIQ